MTALANILTEQIHIVHKNPKTIILLFILFWNNIFFFPVFLQTSIKPQNRKKVVISGHMHCVFLKFILCLFKKHSYRQKRERKTLHLLDHTKNGCNCQNCTSRKPDTGSFFSNCHVDTYVQGSEPSAADFLGGSHGSGSEVELPGLLTYHGVFTICIVFVKLIISSS